MSRNFLILEMCLSYCDRTPDLGRQGGRLRVWSVPRPQGTPPTQLEQPDGRLTPSLGDRAQDQDEFLAYRGCPEHMGLITGVVKERVADVSSPSRHARGSGWVATG